MNSFVITCCSTVDLPKEYFEKNNIPYACYHYIMDGEEYSDDLGQSIPYPEFYQRIAAGSMPTTSQINISEFMAFFEPFLQEGKDILHISMSSGISGTCNSAMNAKEELLAKYPERTIKVVDSLAASSGYGLFLDKLVEMRDAGKSLEEIYLFAEDNKLKLQHWFFSTDLTHFKRGGRISATAATLGNILNLCPLMNVDYVGKLIVRQKIRGKKKVIVEIVNKMIELADGGKGVVTVMHDLPLAFTFSDRILLINEGEVVCDGLPEKVCEENAVKQIFGIALNRSEDGRSYRYQY